MRIFHGAFFLSAFLACSSLVACSDDSSSPIVDASVDHAVKADAAQPTPDLALPTSDAGNLDAGEVD